MSLTAQYLFNNVQINFSLHLWLILCDSYIYFASTFVHLFTWFKISLCLSHSIYTTSIVQCDHMVWQSLRSVSVSNLFTATRRLWGREQPTYRKAQTWTCTHKKKRKVPLWLFFCVCVRALRWRASGPHVSPRVREVRHSATSHFAQREPVTENSRGLAKTKICLNSTIQTHQTQTDWSCYSKNKKKKGGVA